jgi:hypothetical protein
MKDPSNIIAADLSTQERVLLFCLASGTEWPRPVSRGQRSRQWLFVASSTATPPRGSC